MNKYYYSAIFNASTWETFISGKANIMGYRKKLKIMDEIKKGDIFICYMSREYKFFALLEIESEYFFDETKIWDEDTFPHRFEVRVITNQSMDKAINIKEQFNKLELFQKLKKPDHWAGFFMSSPRKFSDNDGKLLYTKLIDPDSKSS